MAATARGVVGARPPVIYSAFVDPDNSEISVVGERFNSISSPVRMQLGTSEITVIAATDSVVTARLPQPIADGIYRLDLITAQGVATLSIAIAQSEASSAPIAPAASGAGPAGPAGPRGEKGDKGDKGDTGLAGTIGAAGAPGPQGPAGPQGAAGSAGPTGSTGATGPQGAAGPAGVAGPPGATGPQGIQGPTGPAGAAGPAGQAGATGPQGAAGILNVQLVESDAFQGDASKDETTRGTVLCPDKSVVLGGGAMTEAADGNWALQESFPSIKPQSWQVYYIALDSNAKQVTFRVYALCATLP